MFSPSLFLWKHPEKGAARMRTLPFAILVIGMVSAAAPARAQAYDPNFPVCLQSYGRAGDNIDCSFTTLPQCKASASGISAQCYTNPFFASAREPAGYRRHRRAY
jgi:Protein of unknown function (DUF3551)